MADETAVRGWKLEDDANDPDSIRFKTVPADTMVYEITGPMFFGDADQLAGIHFKDFTRVIIIRMRGVPALDATAMHSMEQLYEKCAKQNVKLVFSHVNEQPYHTMEKSGFVELVGKDNFRPRIDDAIDWASKL